MFLWVCVCVCVCANESIQVWQSQWRNFQTNAQSTRQGALSTKDWLHRHQDEMVTAAVPDPEANVILTNLQEIEQK